MWNNNGRGSNGSENKRENMKRKMLIFTLSTQLAPLLCRVLAAPAATLVRNPSRLMRSPPPPPYRHTTNVKLRLLFFFISRRYSSSLLFILLLPLPLLPLLCCASFSSPPLPLSLRCSAVLPAATVIVVVAASVSRA